MRLSELDPKFLKRLRPDAWKCWDVSREEADGLMFLCPKCFKANGGAISTHTVICWRPSVPQDTSPTGGRWEIVGTGFDDLSLIAASSSVRLDGGCRAHFWVRNGEIVDA